MRRCQNHVLLDRTTRILVGDLTRYKKLSSNLEKDVLSRLMKTNGRTFILYYFQERKNLYPIHVSVYWIVLVFIFNTG
jgi:hypothetical protein